MYKNRAITEFPVVIHGWTVKSYVGQVSKIKGRSQAIYKAKCPYCVRVKELSLGQIKHDKSCGCMRYKLSGKSNTKHGDSGTRLHSIWNDMRRRCKDTPSGIKKFPYHAGKGIKVTPEWLDYSVFKAWAYSNGYEDSLSIDRRSGDDNYTPTNCRWVDDFTQAQNQTISILNTSGYEGVDARGNGYTARITHLKNRVYLGKFDTAEDAVIARNNYVIKNRTNHKIQIVKQRI